MRALLLSLALLTAFAPATRALACDGCGAPDAAPAAGAHAQHHGGAHAQQVDDAPACDCGAAQGCHGAGFAATATAPAAFVSRAQLPLTACDFPHHARGASPPPLRPPAVST
jgi:hypothetical protein